MTSGALCPLDNGDPRVPNDELESWLGDGEPLLRTCGLTSSTVAETDCWFGREASWPEAGECAARLIYSPTPVICAARPELSAMTYLCVVKAKGC